MPKLGAVEIGSQPVEPFTALLGAERVTELKKVAREVARKLHGRVVWNVNSTSAGGGVAEMLRSVLPYVRALGIDVRWLVIEGSPEFFRVTKRLHHALHGANGDGTRLGKHERETYEQVLAANAAALVALVRPRDFVILHDPQTAGLAPVLERIGAIVIWRCHVGNDAPGREVNKGWQFLAPYLSDVDAAIFSRTQYIPRGFNDGRSFVIAPSIDPRSPKNQDLDAGAIRAILVQAGLIAGPRGEGAPSFVRSDGTAAKIQHRAKMLNSGPAPDWGTPLVVQVSRWDPLKDPVGVIQGFVTAANGSTPAGSELVLAGPDSSAVADDPEGAASFEEVVTTWRRLPGGIRRRVHIACLPMADIDQNAAIVNALQRHAAVVVQKSLHEGFGLTVTEAMWKARPVLASAVGGIQDQIQDGVHGLLVRDPRDPGQFGARLVRLLEDVEGAASMGTSARERVIEQYLFVRPLMQYAELLLRIDRRARRRALAVS